MTITGCVIKQASVASPDLLGSAVEFLFPVALTIDSSTIVGFEGAVGVTGTPSTVAITRSAITAPLGAPTDGNVGIGTLAPLTVSDSTVTGGTGIEDDDANLTLTRTVVRAEFTGVHLQDDFQGAHVALRDSVVAPGVDTLDTGVRVTGVTATGTDRPTVSLTGDTILSRSDTAARALDVTTAAPGTLVGVHNTILRAIDPGAGTDQADIATGSQAIGWDIGYSSYTTTAGLAIPAPGSGTNLDAVPHFVDDTGADLHLDFDSTLFDSGDPTQVQPGETDVAGAPRALAHVCGGAALPDVGAYEATVFCPVPPGGPLPVVKPPTTTTETTAAPPPPPPVSAASPPADKTPPKISHLSFASSHFAAAASTHHHKATVHRETKLRFTLTEAAAVKVVVEQTHHHSHHHHSTYTTKGSVTYHGEKKGSNSRTFSGRINGHALHTGDYRAVIIATDAAGNASSHHHLSFTIVHH